MLSYYRLQHILIMLNKAIYYHKIIFYLPYVSTSLINTVEPVLKGPCDERPPSILISSLPWADLISSENHGDTSPRVDLIGPTCPSQHQASYALSSLRNANKIDILLKDSMRSSTYNLLCDDPWLFSREY